MAHILDDEGEIGLALPFGIKGDRVDTVYAHAEIVDGTEHLGE